MRHQLPKNLFLGRKPFVADPKGRDLFFANYAPRTADIVVPKVIDWTKGVKAWGMLGNDTVGDCTIAGIMHLIMSMQASLGVAVTFTTQQAIALYSAITGYDPSDPNSDQGAELVTVLKYVKKHQVGGFTVDAYSLVNNQNLVEFYKALYLCKGTYSGVNLPRSALDQFRQGKPWTIVKNSPIEGGHCIEPVRRVPSGKGSMITVVTWGAEQDVTEDWWREYADETRAVVSKAEIGPKGRDVLGYDEATLIADAKAVSK